MPLPAEYGGVLPLYRCFVIDDAGSAVQEAFALEESEKDGDITNEAMRLVAYITAELLNRCICVDHRLVVRHTYR